MSMRSTAFFVPGIERDKPPNLIATTRRKALPAGAELVPVRSFAVTPGSRRYSRGHAPSPRPGHGRADDRGAPHGRPDRHRPGPDAGGQCRGHGARRVLDVIDTDPRSLAPSATGRQG